MTVLNLCRIDAQLAGKQSWKHRCMALAGRLDVAAKNELVVARKGQRSLLHWHRAGMLQHAGHAYSAQLLAFRRFTAALVEVVEIGEFQSPVDDGGEIATVISIDRRLERHGRRRNKILLAQSDRSDAGDARRFLHKALKSVVRFRSPGAAVRTDGDRIAEVAGDRYIDFRNPVHAGQATREIVRIDVDPGGADVSSLIAQVAHA